MKTRLARWGLLAFISTICSSCEIHSFTIFNGTNDPLGIKIKTENSPLQEGWLVISPHYYLPTPSKFVAEDLHNLVEVDLKSRGKTFVFTQGQLLEIQSRYPKSENWRFFDGALVPITRGESDINGNLIPNGGPKYVRNF